MKTIKAYEVGLKLRNIGGMQGDLYIIKAIEDTVEDVKAYLNKYYSEDTVLYIKETPLVHGETLLSELEEGVAYEMSADSDQTNASVEITKQGEWVQIYIKGGDFSDSIYIHKFIPSKVSKLAIKLDIHEEGWYDVNNLTLNDIDLIGATVYEGLTGMEDLGEEFKEVAEIVVNNNLERREEKQ
ncbi:hypothetical protein P4493_04340 [Bacillus thuringiensis]|jgi:hypothetical protein|uniref:Uncharacterized protein n=3 Tax=Bacillus thuringiensis TaxID=1428 RepID=A0A0B5NCY8_BACTU|nr:MULTISPECIES: hypothetical protein [Bacillus]MEC2534479.1 hypothetical protein [Bacillus cereus]MED1153780.1 hypothetical protein [Bacillus paranthracis]OUB09358.1 hypothetical protein BK708_33075 [Bacillus thuringiensis serovar yunnanensis]AFQ30092.1 hypothetical protein BTF1_29957 [Bacillus thuringiensis HD-789]AJG74190.1 hypothetical protein BF38_5894 [Bacillus thuringiensis]